MNISPERLVAVRSSDGEGADEKSPYVDEALRQSRKVGYQTGLPLVEAEEYETPRLGESVDHLYEHYTKGDDVFMPSAGSFLESLFDQPEITSLDDAAEELGPQVDRSDLEKAADLHGLEVPEDRDTPAKEADDAVTLPSGEDIPKSILNGPTDKLVLSALFSMGMSVEEVSLYLREETEESVSPSDVRQAAQRQNLLPGGEEIHTADDGYASVPW